MIFENISFMKPNIPFIKEYCEQNPAPMFRKKFQLTAFSNAKVYVCGLGYGYYWINGKKISEDLFTAPVSDYQKTLWYNVYDVTSLLQEGENIIAIQCGNGFFNETLSSPWNHNTATWRDNPKVILQLLVDDKTVVISDDTWKCTTKTAITFNQLRNGEYFDARLYCADWNQINYDDSNWDTAILDQTPPTGIFRECKCEPIREFAEYPTKQIIQTGENKFIFDIGQNISGYIRLKVKQKCGDVVTIRYGEQLQEDHSLQLNGMEGFYPNTHFQTDKFICNGKEFTWSPKFTYHGFRYMEIEGIQNPDVTMVTGIFVHQAIDSISDFECSNPILNRLFAIGKMAVWSNLFYMPTDCPTREKLGWANDAQASAEQMLTNFKIADLFRKWMVDITDAMREDGAMPGIIPTHGWGYDWGNGPVSDGVMFEIPYKIYLFTGDKSLLCNTIPWFKRYFAYLDTRCDTEGRINYGLNDWAAPSETHTPLELINTIFLIKFLRIAQIAAEFAKETAWITELQERLTHAETIIFRYYVNADGTCTIHEQTAVSMLIFHKIYKDLAPLKTQLKKLVEDADYHHNCGMVGLRHLYIALNECGLQEYAYKIITATGYPSYTKWLDGDATTLWEMWQPGASKNHHMYSDFMAWMMKTLVGINYSVEQPAFETVLINPSFVPELEYCKGYCDTCKGKVEVEWKRLENKIELTFIIPHGMKAIYRGETFYAGKTIILL